jgi:hypothetical protein
LVSIENSLTQGAEVVVIEEVLVLRVLDKVAGKVEEKSTSASDWCEKIVFLKLLFFGLEIGLFVLNVSGAEKLIKVSSPQRENGGNEAVLAESTHFILRN